MRRHPLAPEGFTLIEILVVITMIGALLAVALPRFRTSTLKGAVNGAVDVVASLHSVAKQAAIQRGRTSMLVLRPSTKTAVVVARGAGGIAWDTVGKVEDLDSRFGVTFTTTRDTLVFTPRGIGQELSGTTITITKGEFTRTLTVSAAGRLVR